MHPKDLRIEDFTYTLPEERIAQRPLAQRDASKLLVSKEGTITDRSFRELPEALPEGTLLILNDTRVVRARIRMQRATGAVLECMVLTPEAEVMELALLHRRSSRWWCMVGNAKRWKGEDLIVEKDGRTLRAVRIDQRDGEHLIEFSWDSTELFFQQLEHFGSVPLPPYMRRAADADDDARYNTVFAERDGSVAAPTASLHFTEAMLEELGQRGIGTTSVTLHVGAGTFLPVKSATMADHRMHTEQVRIWRPAVEALYEHLEQGPIIPVGTTAMRTIESLYWYGVDLLEKRTEGTFNVDQWRPYNAPSKVSAKRALEAVLDHMDNEELDMIAGSTRLMIAPGYTFRMAQALITNFHQPHSTLLLLVAALLGPQWRSVYDHALANGYRFLSYGDSSLLWGER